MDRQTILNEINRRKNLSSSFSKSQIEEELEKRKIKAEEDSRTPMSYMVDDIDIAPSNERSRAVQEYLTSPEFGRLALEITGGVVGAAFPPAAIVGRAALLVKPALQQAAKRMMGAGVGEMTGAAVSQTFDPSFNSQDDFSQIAKDISKDLLRAGATGVAGEGAGQLIGKGITKLVGRNKKLLEGAEDAVKIIEEQKAKILTDPKSYSKEVKDAVKVGQLTPALLQKGQTIDILENVSESSLFGGGALRYAKEGANTIAQSGLDDFLKIYKIKAGDGALGQLFQKTLTKDLQAFKSIANTKYKAVDDALNTNNFANNFQVDLTNLKTFAAEELKNLGLKDQ